MLKIGLYQIKPWTNPVSESTTWSSHCPFETMKVSLQCRLAITVTLDQKLTYSSVL